MRLATVVSHPIQYYFPWFQYIAQNTTLQNKVFYLWDYGIKKTYDPDFKRYVYWHLPMLEGYSCEIIKNVSKNPGTHHFYGLNNPELINKILEFNPHAILFFGYFSLSHFHLLLSKRLKKIPKIVKGDSHRLFKINSFKNKFKEKIITNIFAKFNAALFVGSVNKNYFTGHGLKDYQLFFSPHAVDKNRFYPDDNCRNITREKWQVTEKETVILFCGKLEEKKCPVELAKTFSENSNSNLRLFYVGSGQLEQSIRSYAVKDNRIKMLGFVEQSKISEIYRAADFVVLPSYGQYETWGFSLQEAISCGTPAIASTHVGCSHDLIKHGKSGYIFNAGDWYGLNQIFNQLKLENSFYRQMGMYGFNNIKKYNYNVATFGLLSALEYLYK